MAQGRPKKLLRGTVEQFRTRFAGRRSREVVSPRQPGTTRPGTPQDVTSVRAKSSGHRKVSADKWNQ